MNVVLDGVSHSWPVEVSADEFLSFPSAGMSCCWYVMVECDNVSLKFVILGNVDFAVSKG